MNLDSRAKINGTYFIIFWRKYPRALKQLLFLFFVVCQTHANRNVTCVGSGFAARATEVQVNYDKLLFFLVMYPKYISKSYLLYSVGLQESVLAGFEPGIFCLKDECCYTEGKASFLVPCMWLIIHCSLKLLRELCRHTLIVKWKRLI